MRYLPTILFALSLTVCVPVNAQRVAKSTEVRVSMTQKSYFLTGAYTPNPQNYYNPWSIHKKIALYGLGGSWGATFLGSIAMNDQLFGSTIIPVVGPFVTMVRIENDPAYFYRPGSKSLLIASGVTQTAFLAYLVIAWIGETSYDARHRSNFSVMPTVGGVGTGIHFEYRF